MAYSSTDAVQMGTRVCKVCVGVWHTLHLTTLALTLYWRDWSEGAYQGSITNLETLR